MLVVRYLRPALLPRHVATKRRRRIDTPSSPRSGWCLVLCVGCALARAREASFHSIADGAGKLEEALNKIVLNGLPGTLSRAASGDSATESTASSFDPDIWLRGLVWPAIANTWQAFSKEEAPRCLNDYIAEAQSALGIFTQHQAFRDLCSDMLDDFKAYLFVLQSAAEPPRVRPSEVSGSPPLANTHRFVWGSWGDIKVPGGSIRFRRRRPSFQPEWRPVASRFH